MLSPRRMVVDKPSLSCDVTIIGGGPAGSSLGGLLASWGHSVLLIARPADRARGLAESIPPSACKLLDAAGVLDAVDRSAFAPNRGNHVWWAGAEARVESFDEDRTGWLVFRPDLDAALLASARAAGADVRTAAAKTIRPGNGSHARVDYEQDGGVRTVATRFVADCSGRTGVLARRGLRQPASAHRMQAYVGRWDDPAPRSPDENRTLVETYRDGWAWSLPISPTARQVAVMVDGGVTQVSRGPTIGDALAAELAKTRHIRSLVGDSALTQAWACDASMYTARRFTGPGFVLVGDAGSAIDPLSSSGTKKAIGSAWLAAVALHTALVDTSREAIALDFFARREQEVFEAELARTREYAGLASASHGGEFWRARSANGASPPLDRVAALLKRDEVVLAHRRLRAAATIGAADPGCLRLTPQPVVRGKEIVLEDALQLKDAALRYAAAVDLRTLVGIADRRRDVYDAYRIYCQIAGDVALPQFLTAAALLLAEGVLTDAGAE